MKPTEQIATPASTPKTGLFALLGAFSHAKGTSAPKTSQGTSTPSPTPVLATLTAIAATLLATAGLTAILPAAASAYATLEGPATFSSAPGLPDGRVYEQVSPANKNGNEAGATTQAEISSGTQHYGYAAPDGNSVLFEGTGPMGESPSVDNFEFVAHRSAAGWSTRALEPALHRDGKSVEELFDQTRSIDPSQDLSHAMVQSDKEGTLASSLPNEACDEQLYLTGPDPFLAATWLGRSEIPDPVEECPRGSGVGGTPDFSTVYFASSGRLLAEDSVRREGSGFYAYSEGVLHEAGVLPGGGGLDPFGATRAADPREGSNEVSSDGSRAFFVSPGPASCKGTVVGGHEGEDNCAVDPPELYVRENGAKTVLVSQDMLLPDVSGLPAATPHGVLEMPAGSYVFASPDGSQAFFQSEDQLTADAPANTSPKTYDFDLNTGELTYLPNVTGQIAVTDTDGSSFAFVRPAAGGAPAELDLWSAGPGGGSITSVTQLPEPEAQVSEARMSSDGSVLVFETGSRLSSAFNSGGQNEIYRYDVLANTLGCVSCAPAGVTPSGPASISSVQPAETYEYSSPVIHGAVDSRGISADGDRVFFDSPDPLVPQDTNTNSPAVSCKTGGFCPQGRDVYEWENGVVYLISGGKSPRSSFLLDNSESGEDVFFATAESLVAGDTDGGYDVYDARVPRETQTPVAVPCAGSVCQGPPNVPSPLTPPASATFSGLGNPTPEVTPPPPAKATTKTVKCKKGFTKKKNKCVKSKAKKKAKKASADRRVK